MGRWRKGCRVLYTWLHTSWIPIIATLTPPSLEMRKSWMGSFQLLKLFTMMTMTRQKKKWKTLWQAKSSPQWGYAQIQTSRWPLCKTCINGWLLVFVMYFISASCWNVSKFIYLYTCAAKWWENYGTQVQHCKGWPVVVVNLFIFVESAFSMAGQLLQQ